MESLKNSSNNLLIINIIEIILVFICILFIIIIIYRYQIFRDEHDITTTDDVKVHEDEFSVRVENKTTKNNF
jgi:Na+/melibiose symporter-like transporter